MNQIDPGLLAQALADFQTQKWVLLLWLIVSVVAGGLVRLCKSDSPIKQLQAIPPAWRARLAYVFALAAALAAKIATGMPWADALQLAVVGGTTAIGGHELLVEGLRNGKEPFAATTPAGTPKAGGRRHVAFTATGAFAAALALAVAGCIGAAVVPASATLGVCIANVIHTATGFTFLQYVAKCVAACGADALAVLEAILKNENNDPAIAAFQDEARETKADPAKLAAFRSKVGAYIAAHPELAAPAAPAQDGGR